MGELIFNLVLLAAAAVMLVMTGQIQTAGDPLAKYWPAALILILIVMLVIKIIGLIRQLAKDNIKFNIKDFGFGNHNIRMLILSFIWAIAYAKLLPLGGYLLCTFIFCLGLTYILGCRCWWKMIVISFAITIILFAIFTWGLGVHPPRGKGVLEKMSKELEYLFR